MRGRLVDHAIDERHLEGASNVLVLGPLTLDGTSTCQRALIAETPPANTDVVAVTYTQPPESWMADWRDRVGDLPAKLSFVYANRVGSGEEHSSLADGVTVSRVDPREPMDVVSPVSESLARWADDGNRRVLSVETISVLLNYMDLKTAFRYLHLLSHRIRAADAVGYYHVDPENHDAETVNTLKPLFDAVVAVSPDGEDWSVVETGGNDAPTRARAPSHDTSDAESSPGAFESVRSLLSNLVSGKPDATSSASDPTTATGSQTDEATAGGEGDATPDPSRPGDASDRDAERVGYAPDDPMRTDEDRICRMLADCGGRMKQAEVAEHTDWSASTVSRKLSAAEDEGLITRVRVGSEKLVFLSGDEPELAKPPSERITNR